jgi:hypothetical protein
LWISLGAGACHSSPPVLKAGAKVSLAPFSTRAYGLSDLARDPNGQYWTVAERGLVLVPLTIHQSTLRAGEPIALQQVPADVDLESMAFLPSGELLFGTEKHEADRPNDLLLRLREPRTATVSEQVSFSYEPWSLIAANNRGIEAMCSAGETILVGLEDAQTIDGARTAPLARWDPNTGTITAYRVALSSETGLLSALTCRALPSGEIEALAVERNYGVARILRVMVPLAAPAHALKPTVWLDLAQEMDNLPNIEGIAWLDDGRLLMTTDNSSGGENLGIFAPGPPREAKP